MAKYFCPVCAVDCEEPICKYCNNPAEPLDVNLEDKEEEEKYSQDDLSEVKEDLNNLDDDDEL